MKYFILVLCLFLMACSAPVETADKPPIHSSPAPSQSVTNSFSWKASLHFSEGISWPDAKKAIEEKGVTVSSMSILNRDGTDYYTAIVRLPDDSIRVFMLRSFTADGETFVWRADIPPPGLYEKLLAPPDVFVNAP